MLRSCCITAHNWQLLVHTVPATGAAHLARTMDGGYSTVRAGEVSRLVGRWWTGFSFLVAVGLVVPWQTRLKSQRTN